jgi:hypothetical protein
MNTVKKFKIDIADIFNKYMNVYRQRHKISYQQQKVINAIMNCRTAFLGNHTSKCTKCGHLETLYNSCRNRHCPKCQVLVKEIWLEKRKSELLPVKYFHIVFTLPHTLNTIALQEKELIYNILFKAAWDTIKAFSEDIQYLGAKTGMVAVLHSWGQNLSFHPHLHCLLPAGGLSEDGIEWIDSKQNFFAPVKAMSKVFKGKFLDCLKQAFLSKHLGIQISAKEFDRLLSELYTRDWIVFAKKPFGRPEYVIDYLGKYTHRIAISNYRLVKLENDLIWFRYKDYKDKSRIKLMKLHVDEFIRRFLQHILPNGFCKVRYFGLFANRNKKENIEICRQIFCDLGRLIENQLIVSDQNWKKLLKRLTGIDPGKCPKCGGRMVIYDIQPQICDSA